MKNREAWRAAVLRVAKSQARLSDWTTTTEEECNTDPLYRVDDSIVLSGEARHTGPRTSGPIDMKCPRQADPRRQRADERSPGAGAVGVGSGCLWAQGFLWGNEAFWDAIEVTAARRSKPARCHQVIH